MAGPFGGRSSALSLDLPIPMAPGPARWLAAQAPVISRHTWSGPAAEDVHFALVSASPAVTSGVPADVLTVNFVRIG
jgi:hypothetical protein